MLIHFILKHSSQKYKNIFSKEYSVFFFFLNFFLRKHKKKKTKFYIYENYSLLKRHLAPSLKERKRKKSNKKYLIKKEKAKATNYWCGDWWVIIGE